MRLPWHTRLAKIAPLALSASLHPRYQQVTLGLGSHRPRKDESLKHHLESFSDGDVRDRQFYSEESVRPSCCQS